MKKSALISVYNKKNINLICEFFYQNNIQIISTGSTAKIIKKYGYKCKLVKDITNFKEMLDGRVKTLQASIHASILFQRNKKRHLYEFSKLKFPTIDYVIVNLYPFENQINRKRFDKRDRSNG